MKFSVCVDALFPQREFSDIYERINRAVTAGINTIEFWWWPYKDIDAVAKAVADFDAEIYAFCVNETELTDKNVHDKYVQAVRDSVETAKKLNCRHLICSGGNIYPELSQRKHHENIVKGLKRCASVAEQNNIILLLEPLNNIVDHKENYLCMSDEAAEIIDEVGSENVKILFDIYHQQISEGNIIDHITKHLPKIGHIHCAGVPGRHGIGTGELDYGRILKVIEKLGYSGTIGLECFTEEPEEEIKNFLSL